MSIKTMLCRAVTVAPILLATTNANALWMKASTPKWPNGNVPVCLTSRLRAAPNFADFYGRLVGAANRWSGVARVNFQGLDSTCSASCVVTQPNPPISVFSQTGCPAGTLVIDYMPGAKNSGVGYNASAPTLSIRDPQIDNTSDSLHELGHALGFEHEQDRTENVLGGGSFQCDQGVSTFNGAAIALTAFDYWGVMDYCRGVGNANLTQRDVAGVKAAYGSRIALGVFQNAVWSLDINGNGVWDPWAGDFGRYFGAAGDRPVVIHGRPRDSSGSDPGHTAMAVFRGNGQWFYDSNLNGTWDANDTMYSFGATGDLPVAGPFRLPLSGGTPSRDHIGVVRGGSHWFLDGSTTGIWGDDFRDTQRWFGQAGDQPVVGNWVGGGVYKAIGVYRGAGQWLLDANDNGTWDGADTVYYFGQAGDLPIVGDWNGDGRDKIGVFRNGQWLLDFNGDGIWNPDDVLGDVSYSFGSPGDIPVVGDWY